MKKLKLLISIFFLCFELSAQHHQMLWPIKGQKTGEGIIYNPQDTIDGVLNFADLYISAKENSIVISPCDGIVSSWLFCKKSSKCTKPGSDDPKFFSYSLGIKIDKNETIYISGLNEINKFKSGEKISKGQIIGTVSYAHADIPQPCISINRSIFKKPADPMSIFGIKSTFIPPVHPIDYYKKNLSVKQLLNDFNEFKEALEEGHPGLYDYTSKHTMYQLFNDVKEKLTKPMSSREFNLILLPILNAIKDSHTAILLSMLKVDKNIMPSILFGLQKDSVVVYSTLPQYKKDLNKKIIAINGVTIDSIIPQLKNLFYGYDGHIESVDKRKLLLDFWKYYRANYLIKKGDSILIKFSDKSAETVEYNQYNPKKFFPLILNRKNNSNYSTSFLSENIAYLDLNTFRLFDTDLDNIQDFIKEIKKRNCENLIIDVRDNFGGDVDALCRIYSYIANETFRIRISSKVNKKDSYNFFKNTIEYDGIRNMFPHYVKIEGKEGYYLPDSLINIYYPNDSISFDKNIYVLTNEYSKSAATIFAALVHKHKRGKIIGRETGSAYYQLNATKFSRIVLENTRLILYIPLVKEIFDKKGNSDIPWGRGVIPEYEVNISFDEFIPDHDDIILNAALNYIQTNQQKTIINILKLNWMMYVVVIVTLIILVLLFQLKRKLL